MLNKSRPVETWTNLHGLYCKVEFEYTQWYLNCSHNDSIQMDEKSFHTLQNQGSWKIREKLSYIFCKSWYMYTTKAILRCRKGVQTFFSWIRNEH